MAHVPKRMSFWQRACHITAPSILDIADYDEIDIPKRSLVGRNSHPKGHAYPPLLCLGRNEGRSQSECDLLTQAAKEANKLSRRGRGMDHGGWKLESAEGKRGSQLHLQAP